VAIVYLGHMKCETDEPLPLINLRLWLHLTWEAADHCWPGGIHSIDEVPWAPTRI